MKKSILVFAAVFSVVFTGCAGIVKKPEVDDVKRVAIISVFSNVGVYNLGGGGGLTEGFAALNNLAKTTSGENLTAMDFGGTRLVEHAHRSFQTELGKVRNWEMIPSEKILAHPAYQAFLKTSKAASESLGMLGKLADANWVTSPGMSVYPLRHMEPSGSRRLKELADLCQALGADAVAVIQLDNAYSASTSFGGSGSASASVASSLKIVNRNAEYAVVTLDVGKNEGRRLASGRTTGMLAGNIAFDQGVEAMYQDVIDQHAVALRETINKELN